LERIGKVDYKATLNLIISFSKDISNWAVCDHLGFSGMRAITPYYLKELFPLLHKWCKNSNKWIRRLAMASLTPLVRDKKYKSSGKEFEIISNLMKDEDKDVKKGVSWVLREFTKKDSQKVFNFLIKWAKSNPDKNTKWILKDGMKKLPKEKQTEILSILDKQTKAFRR
jgi:3-methyladenine DNA glycosylase AlkD